MDPLIPGVGDGYVPLPPPAPTVIDSVTLPTDIEPVNKPPPPPPPPVCPPPPPPPATTKYSSPDIDDASADPLISTVVKMLAALPLRLPA